MTHYPVHSWDRIFVKVYGFLSFARNMGRNIIKNLSSKFSLKPLDSAKQYDIHALKTASKKLI